MTSTAQRSPVDCAVIGGGPAGLAAALVLGRSRRRTVVVDAGRPANRSVEHSHGFFTRDGIAPAELAAIGRAQLAPYGVEVLDGAVTRVRPDAVGFVVEVDGGRVLSARRLVVATGVRYDLPPLHGLAETWGRSAAGCPYCHGWELQDRALGVLGVDPEHASRLAVMLRQWSADVTLYLQGADADTSLPASRGVRVEQLEVTEIEHTDGQVTALRLGDGSRSACGGLFVAAPPSFDPTLLRGLGVPLDPATGWPIVDQFGKAQLDGVWMAGTAANPMLTLLESAASGARAAMMLNSEWVLSGAP